MYTKRVTVHTQLQQTNKETQKIQAHIMVEYHIAMD